MIASSLVDPRMCYVRHYLSHFEDFSLNALRRILLRPAWSETLFALI